MSSALIWSTMTEELRLTSRALRSAPRMPVTTTSSTVVASSSWAVWAMAGAVVASPAMSATPATPPLRTAAKPDLCELNFDIS